MTLASARCKRKNGGAEREKRRAEKRVEIKKGAGGSSIGDRRADHGSLRRKALPPDASLRLFPPRGRDKDAEAR